MLIDNFKEIENFMKFEPGYFYKFEALVRNTDGANPLYYEGISSTNKNILIKNWFIDNEEYYNRMKNEMVTLCNLTGARLYITLDRKETKRVLIELFKEINEICVRAFFNDFTSIKSLTKLISSKTSVKESSDKYHKTIMFDVDTKDFDTLEIIADYIRLNGEVPYTLNTKKGYHVFCYKNFNITNWQSFCKSSIDTYNVWADVDKLDDLKKVFEEQVSVKDNELGLIYMNKEE